MARMSIEEDLVDAWEINNRINLFLLDAIEEPGLSTKPVKGRTPRSQFAHMHNVRLMWLKSAAPELLEHLDKLDGDKATKAEIAAALVASGAAIATLISTSCGPDKRVKGFKPHTAAFVTYIVSHESHHRGMTELTLRQTGFPVSDKVSYGLWEWGTR